MRKDYARNAQGIRKDYARNAQGLRKDYAKVTHAMRKDYAKNAQGLSKDYAKITQRLRKECATITQYATIQQYVSYYTSIIRGLYTLKRFIHLRGLIITHLVKYPGSHGVFHNVSLSLIMSHCLSLCL